MLSLPARPPNLRIGRELGRGAWGTVHEGDLDGESVAVKKIHELLKDAQGSAVRTFCGECERLKTVHHHHVIKFLGAFRDAEFGPILVMEKMKENLRQFLEDGQKLIIQEQIRISHEITQGVAFLHQLTPPMVHRDLNDKNVMFTFDGVVKIGDFGQSKLMKDDYLTSTAPGMLSFMPPECQHKDGNKYDESIDVFSLGVLMLEIGTQRLPISNVFGIGVIPEVDRRGKDLQRMSDLHPLKPFILLCLSDDRRKRPKATELEMVLPRLKENVLQTMLATEQSLHTMEVNETQRQLQSYENELARKRMEVEEYTKQYQTAEAKRLEASSHINELTLVALGMEPQGEADREMSAEELRKLHHLAKKQNEAWEEIFRCTIQEFQHQIELQEMEIMRLRTQLSGTELGSSEVHV